MKKMIVLAFLFSGLAALALAAEPPALVNYQGVLRDASDKVMNGTFDMAFRFYDAASGGNEILIDGHTGGAAVTVSKGVFNVHLGGGTVTDGSGPGTYTSLRGVFGDYSSLYMEIRIGSETLTPRVRLLSTGFASNADRLDGYDASAFAASAHAHDGADVTTGKVNNARLNTGAGNGLDADTVDGLHAVAFVPATTNASVSTKAIRQGATVVWESTSQIRIKPGILGFSDGKTRESSADLVWDFANGVGDLGLDIGSEAADTWYYLYAVPNLGNPDRFTVVASTQSPTQAGGAGPLGYPVYRFIGSFLNNVSSNIRRFFRSGTAVHWDGKAASWLTSCFGSLPPSSLNAWTTIDASGNQPQTSRVVRLTGVYDICSGASLINVYIAPGMAPPTGNMRWCSAYSAEGSNVCQAELATISRKFSYYVEVTAGGNEPCQCVDFGYAGYDEDLNEF